MPCCCYHLVPLLRRPVYHDLTQNIALTAAEHISDFEFRKGTLYLAPTCGLSNVYWTVLGKLTALEIGIPSVIHSRKYLQSCFLLAQRLSSFLCFLFMGPILLMCGTHMYLLPYKRVNCNYASMSFGLNDSWTNMAHSRVTYHIRAEIKIVNISQTHFHTHFLEWKCMNFDLIYWRAIASLGLNELTERLVPWRSQIRQLHTHIKDRYHQHVHAIPLM